MTKDPRLQFIAQIEKNSQKTEEFILTGGGLDHLMLRPTYSGFISYQVSDPESTLSGGLTINLEMSNDGENWLQATDASDTDITNSLSVGSSILQKLTDVNPAIKFRLAFASAVTGTLQVSTRI